MIYDYLFYYIFKFFKLIKSDDDTASFKAIMVLTFIAYFNIMILILLLKLSGILKIEIFEIIHIVFLSLLMLSLFYFNYGYKNKYKPKLLLIESTTSKQKLKYVIFSLIFVIISFVLPFVLGIYFKVSM